MLVVLRGKIVSVSSNYIIHDVVFDLWLTSISQLYKGDAFYYITSVFQNIKNNLLLCYRIKNIIHGTKVHITMLMTNQNGSWFLKDKGWRNNLHPLSERIYKCFIYYTNLSNFKNFDKCSEITIFINWCYSFNHKLISTKGFTRFNIRIF